VTNISDDVVQAMLARLASQGASGAEATADGEVVNKIRPKVDANNVDWDNDLMTPYAAAQILSKKRGTIRAQNLYYGVRNNLLKNTGGKVTLRDCEEWLDRSRENAGMTQALRAQQADSALLAKINELRKQEELVSAKLPGRLFGVEIEFDPKVVLRDEVVEALNEEGIPARKAKYSDNNYDRTLVKNDSSCGMEVVTTRLGGSEGLQRIVRIDKILQRLSIGISRKCALHVWWGVDDFTLDHLKRLAVAYIVWEPMIDTMVSASRRGDVNEHAHSLKGVDRPALISATNVEELVAAFKIEVNGPDASKLYNYRKWKLNFAKVATAGAVEFRQHQGTLDPEKTIRWIVFTGRIVQYAKEGGTITAVKSFTQLAHMLKLSESDLAYWKGRIAELEG
jgi:hypothetical protein